MSLPHRSVGVDRQVAGYRPIPVCGASDVDRRRWPARRAKLPELFAEVLEAIHSTIARHHRFQWRVVPHIRTLSRNQLKA